MLMAIDDGKFKLAMSQFVSGVTVVTTVNEGEMAGLTVASFASLSLDPPLALVCIEKSVRSHDLIAAAGHFGVSILASDQAQISNRFASKADDKFAGVPIRIGELGVPLIEGAICTIECRLREALPGGDHSIFVGEVVDIQTTDGAPLVYFRSAYRELAS
jgi:flavin reductase (DIM6/NTAB) family NADH-FMN oxidoreductase RutF